MSMTRRERIIAIATVGAAVLFLFDRFALTPYMNRRQFLNEEQTRITQQLNAAGDLFDRQRHLRPVWADMQAGGLELDASSAESQAMQAVVDWAKRSGVELTAIKPERITPDKQFQVIGFRIVGNGSTGAVSRLLWSLENASIPLRVTDVQMLPRKEGTDDLNVQIGISTLSQLPPDMAADTSGGRS